MNITLYTQANCQPCKAVKRWLDSAGIEYLTLPASEHTEFLSCLGARSAPVTVIGDRIVVGFHPDALHQAIAEC